jgi:hypothetical protein
LPIWDGTEGKTKKVSLAKIPANVITPVDSLPESPNILDRVYRYNNKYYVGNESAQTLTELASKADIPTVVDTVADGNMNPVTSNAVFDSLLAKANVTTWIPNGSNPLTQNTGLFAYSTNPNNLPSQGILSGLSEYGTLIGVGSGVKYPIMLYLSALGDMAIWASKSQSWVKI